MTAELAEAVEGQWTRAAGERRLLEPAPIPVRWRRSSLPIAGPVSAAVGAPGTPARFPPLPGLQQISQGQLEAGGLPELFTVYVGLGSGRLVITGARGCGKSGAAIQLLLDASRHRERVAEDDRPQVPVPTLFTLQGWDPSTQGLEDWLTGRLVETYPLFAGRNGPAEAAVLLAGGEVAVILDGLDEIAEDVRPLALEALSQQARCRVVCSPAAMRWSRQP